MRLSDLEKVNAAVRARKDLNKEAEKLASKVEKNDSALADFGIEVDDELSVTTNPA